MGHYISGVSCGFPDVEEDLVLQEAESNVVMRFEDVVCLHDLTLTF